GVRRYRPMSLAARGAPSRARGPDLEFDHAAGRAPSLAPALLPNARHVAHHEVAGMVTHPELTESRRETQTDYIREAIKEDLRSGRFDRVHTRFPPEPNAYLHIGHAKAVWID